MTDARTGQILATAFCEGRCADFALFKRSRTALSARVLCLADSGYQGLDKRHPHSQTPRKKSKHHPLTDEDKARNRAISQQRIGCEHAIGRLKVFKILSEGVQKFGKVMSRHGITGYEHAQIVFQ